MIASAEMTDYKTISDYAFLNKQKAELERHKSDLRSVWGRFYHIFFDSDPWCAQNRAIYTLAEILFPAGPCRMHIWHIR